MKFEWDLRKARKNIRDHGVTFLEAERAFYDPGCILLSDLVDEDGEERYHLIGASAKTVLLLVVHSYRDYHGETFIRIISARRATPSERELYRAANV